MDWEVSTVGWIYRGIFDWYTFLIWLTGNDFSVILRWFFYCHFGHLKDVWDHDVSSLQQPQVSWVFYILHKGKVSRMELFRLMLEVHILYLCFDRTTLEYVNFPVERFSVHHSHLSWSLISLSTQVSFLWWGEPFWGGTVSDLQYAGVDGGVHSWR